MTYDVSLTKNGRIFPTPLTIHGLAYCSDVCEWAEEFVFADKKLTPEEVKKKGRKFHKLAVKYCQDITGSKNYFGSDGGGYYFPQNNPNHNPMEFTITMRWLQIYITAIAFNCGINFH